MKPDLFTRLHSPYYIVAPDYSTNTDEARCLHHLCHALNLVGEEAYVTAEGSDALRTPLLTQALIDTHLRAGRNPLVVYADSVSGNPLAATNVVRYLIGAGAEAGAGEMLVTRRIELAAPGTQVLTVPLADDAAYAQSRALFARQLEEFIAASQQRFNQAAIVPTDTATPVAPTTLAAAAAARIFPGRLARPLQNNTPAAPMRRPAVPVPAAAPAKRKKRLVVYSVESTWSPCPQIRLIRPFAHLQGDWELIWGIENGRLQHERIANADLIVLHRFTPGLMSIPTLQGIFAAKVPVVYESDDLLNAIPHDHPEAEQGANWKEGIEYAVRHAKAVVVSTEFLAAKYRALNPAVHVLPNYIDYDLFYRPVPPDDRGARINIGLLGSSIQPSNFALVDEALRALTERYGERLHIDFVGWECPKGWEGHPQTTFHSFVHQYVDYAAQLLQWNWDIALIPLASDEYNQCKSYIKWLDYSAAGIASIFSNVSVYNEVVTHDVTGLLMPNSSQAWLEAVTMLIESPQKRQALASTGQQEVRDNFNLRAKAARYGEVYGQYATPAGTAMQ